MAEQKVDWIEDLKKVNLAPGDTIVYRVKGVLSDHMIERIRDQFKRVFPLNKIIVLEYGAELGVISSEVDDAA